MDLNTTFTPVLGFSVSEVATLLGILFALIYALFALIIVRQVQLMTKTMPSPVSPVVVFISIAHVGVVIAVLVLLVGMF